MTRRTTFGERSGVKGNPTSMLWGTPCGRSAGFHHPCTRIVPLALPWLPPPSSIFWISWPFLGSSSIFLGTLSPFPFSFPLGALPSCHALKPPHCGLPWATQGNVPSQPQHPQNLPVQQRDQTPTGHTLQRTISNSGSTHCSILWNIKFKDSEDSRRFWKILEGPEVT